jgi:hypothetical protein
MTNKNEEDTGVKHPPNCLLIHKVYIIGTVGRQEKTGFHPFSKASRLNKREETNPEDEGR